MIITITATMGRCTALDRATIPQRTVRCTARDRVIIPLCVIRFMALARVTIRLCVPAMDVTAAVAAALAEGPRNEWGRWSDMDCAPLLPNIGGSGSALTMLTAHRSTSPERGV